MTALLAGTKIHVMLTFPPIPDTGEHSASLPDLSGLGLADWLWAVGILVVATLLGISVGRLVTRFIDRRASTFIARLVGRVVVAVFVALGFIYGLNQLGVSIGPLLGLLGLVGLAMALAFQDLLGNIIAGVFMSVRRPFDAGHQVSLNGFEGTVESINLREVALVGFDGVRVHIPNSAVWSNPIVNFTELRQMRTSFDVGVSYNTDLDAAREVILEVMAGIHEVSAEPAPEAFVNEFGDSGINFVLRFWHGADFAIQWRTRDRLARALKKRFDAEGITIPFPQRVVHMAKPPITPENR
ncbi:MAG: mechanosensitive ion channel family protein [Acidimicrobiia bacterium]|nr:mechanosensitive ion channel family protein [Acidimicrobiia bacterium]